LKRVNIAALEILDPEVKRELSEKSRTINYRVFYGLGLCLMALGLVFLTISPVYVSLMGSGLVCMALGLSNRDKWTQSETVA
jgi:hypothetical protein